MTHLIVQSPLAISRLPQKQGVAANCRRRHAGNHQPFS
jgi:hypothetical protein